jgi:hypothetical protein
MKKPCKECPWVVRNRHNDTIVVFSKRTGKSHNCHMTEVGKKDLWKVDNENKCIGKKNFENGKKTCVNQKN